MSSIKFDFNISSIAAKHSTGNVTIMYSSCFLVDNNAELGSFLNKANSTFFIDTNSSSTPLVLNTLTPQKRKSSNDLQDSALQSSVTNESSFKFQVTNQEKLSQLYHENKSLGRPFYNYRAISELESTAGSLEARGFKAQLIMGDRIVVSELCTSRTEASEKVAGTMIEKLKEKGLISMDIDMKTDLEMKTSVDMNTDVGMKANGGMISSTLKKSDIEMKVDVDVEIQNNAGTITNLEEGEVNENATSDVGKAVTPLNPIIIIPTFSDISVSNNLADYSGIKPLFSETSINNQPILAAPINEGSKQQFHEQLYIPLDEPETPQHVEEHVEKHAEIERNIYLVNIFSEFTEYQSDHESKIPTYRQLVNDLCKKNYLLQPLIRFVPGSMGGFFCVTSIQKKTDSDTIVFVLDSAICLREHKTKAGALEDVMHDTFILLQAYLASKR